MKGLFCRKRWIFFFWMKKQPFIYATWEDAHIKLCSLQKQIALLLSGLFTELTRSEKKVIQKTKLNCQLVLLLHQSVQGVFY